jgi:hypothetical protein
VRMPPRRQRRNRTGPDPNGWQSASTTPATTWPALPPTLAAQDWQFIHNPVSTRTPQHPGAGNFTTSPDPQRRHEASISLPPHLRAADRSCRRYVGSHPALAPGWDQPSLLDAPDTRSNARVERRGRSPLSRDCSSTIQALYSRRVRSNEC